MLNIIMYQIWILLTFASMIAAALLGIIILRKEVEDSYSIKQFKRAVAFAFFSAACEILSRFAALLIHKAPTPTSELIVCSFGRLIECIGFWGLLLYMLKIWPFNSDK
jgi:hypothetical protein